MISICNIRTMPQYRRDAFLSGLARVGQRVVEGGKPSGPEDWLVIWNRYGAQEQLARTWESVGGSTLVCENGYIGNDALARPLYAISVGGHNGSGWFPLGNEDRFTSLGINVAPWQSNDDGHILIAGQRGIGSKTMASPENWHAHAQRRLAGAGRPVRIRLHPGKDEPKIPLADDLAGAYACAIWSSGSGVKSLVAGIPVAYDAPHWICEGAALKGVERLAGGVMRDDAARNFALSRMAHGQWSVAEIEKGEPFARILAAIRRADPAFIQHTTGEAVAPVSIC